MQTIPNKIESNPKIIFEKLLKKWYFPFISLLIILILAYPEIFFNNKKLYNIFGHNPNGFGPTVDLFENGTYKTYLVNLDNSNTFLSSSLNRSLYEPSLQTSSYILIEANSIKLKTNIFIQYTVRPFIH